MPWYKPKTTKVTFEKFEAPEIEVEVLDVNALPYGQARELSREWERISKLGDDATLNDQDTGLKMLLAKLIHSWNVTDPYTDELLPIPKNDIEVVDKLPMEVLMFLASEAFGGNKDIVPNQIGSEPSISLLEEAEAAQIST